jgi:hypothetical protein
VDRPRLASEHVDPLASPPFSTGSNTTKPAAILAGFAFTPLTAAATRELDTAITLLRGVLGDQTYEQLARKGETMTTAAIVMYAYDQIDQAQAELEQPAHSMGKTKDRR